MRRFNSTAPPLVNRRELASFSQGSAGRCSPPKSTGVLRGEHAPSDRYSAVCVGAGVCVRVLFQIKETVGIEGGCSKVTRFPPIDFFGCFVFVCMWGAVVLFC